MTDSFHAALIENAPDPVVVCDPNWRLRYVNRTAGKYFGWTPDRLAGRAFAELCAEPFDTEAFELSLETGGLTEQLLALRHSNGAISDVIARGVSIAISSGQHVIALYLYPLASGLPGSGPDDQISKLLVSLRSYRQMALTDALTGLPNRRALEEALERECARAARQASYVSVIMLDLDGFKQINDNFGHVVGDEILRRYAHLLHGLTRRSDFLGRYGGDEMLMIIPEVPAGALAYAERLRIAVASQILEAAWGHTTISAGIASTRPSAHDGPALVAQADAMLYEAKRAGGNAVRSISL